VDSGTSAFVLLHDVQKGGEEALKVKKYLESLGVTQVKVKI
jgi:hypothetical protein